MVYISILQRPPTTTIPSSYTRPSGSHSWRQHQSVSQCIDIGAGQPVGGKTRPVHLSTHVPSPGARALETATAAAGAPAEQLLLKEEQKEFGSESATQATVKRRQALSCLFRYQNRYIYPIGDQLAPPSCIYVVLS